MDTSPFAYDHILRDMRRSRPSGEAMEERRFDIYGPLVWLYNLIIRVTVGEPVFHHANANGANAAKVNLRDIVFDSKSSRRTYSLKKRKQMMLELISIRRKMYIDKLFYGGLTPAQKQEKIARISTHGRVKIFGLRYWGTRLQRQAGVVCFDHGWWRTPSIAATSDGLWDVQLPPN